MEGKISIGYDLAARPRKWWQKLLAFGWSPYRRRFSDKSAMVMFRHRKDGTIEMVDHKTF